MPRLLSRIYYRSLQPEPLEPHLALLPLHCGSLVKENENVFLNFILKSNVVLRLSKTKDSDKSNFIQLICKPLKHSMLPRRAPDYSAHKAPIIHQVVRLLVLSKLY